MHSSMISKNVTGQEHIFKGNNVTITMHLILKYGWQLDGTTIFTQRPYTIKASINTRSTHYKHDI